MMQYYDANKNIAAAAKYVVAGRVQRRAACARRPTRTPTSGARRPSPPSRSYKAPPPIKDGKNEALGSLEAGMAAECEYAHDRRGDRRRVRLRHRPPPLRGRRSKSSRSTKSTPATRRRQQATAAARHRRLRVARVGDRGHLAAGQPLRLAAHRPLQHAPAAAQARRRQDREAPQALREERQPRRLRTRPTQIRQKITEAWRARARARAQQRRQGDDPLLRAERGARASATTCATPR